MSELRTYSISGVAGTSVNFPTGVSNFSGPPKVLSFDPLPQSTNSKIDNLQIRVTFDQAIQFSGISTIYLKEGSASGTIVDFFDVNSSRLNTNKNVLTLTSGILDFNTTYYLTIPSDIIKNPQGSYYQGTEDYFFTTDPFSAVGGDASFKVYDINSPTEYYQYHVFTSTGILTTTSPTLNLSQIDGLLVGGGGGGGQDPASPFINPGSGGGAGGVLSLDGIVLPAGSHTITIAAGGAVLTRGGDSTISTPSVTFTAFGGGAGDNSPAPSASPLNSPGGSGAGFGIGYPGQGNPGGPFNGSGGGGAGAAAPSDVILNGGAGKLFVGFSSSLLGPNAAPLSTPDIGLGYYGGGGGGGAIPGGAYTSGSGGIGGGGDGGVATTAAESGTANTGGGGGGSPRALGGAGGSGVFVIRYSVPANY